MPGCPDNNSHIIDWGGDGPLVHIAHAIGLAAGVYTPFAEKLRSIVHPIGLDLPGHGKSPMSPSPNGLKSWDIFYNELEAFLDSLDRPVIAVGHSMGGTVSLVVAARRPDLVSALILIEPGIMPPAWRPWVWAVQKCGLAMHTPFVTRAVHKRSHWPDASTAAEEFTRKGPLRPWRDEFIQAYLEHGMGAGDNGGVKLACDPLWEGRCLAMAPADIWKYVPRIKVPTLVIYGKKSTTFLPSVARKIQSCLPGAEIKGFDDAGHFIPMERPDECLRVIYDFLKYQGLVWFPF